MCGAQGEYVEYIHFFNPVAFCFLHKAKDLSGPLVYEETWITGNSFTYQNSTWRHIVGYISLRIINFPCFFPCSFQCDMLPPSCLCGVLHFMWPHQNNITATYKYTKNIHEALKLLSSWRTTYLTIMPLIKTREFVAMVTRDCVISASITSLPSNKRSRRKYCDREKIDLGMSTRFRRPWIWKSDL
jgi:hypothetical protein